MPTTLRTGKIEMRQINNVVASIRAIATPEFAAEAMNIQEMGDRTLAYLRRIFPKSPSDYPRRGREPLVEGWVKYGHPPKGFTRNVGFTVRRKGYGIRDHTIIASLDQGSRAYQRRIPVGQRSSFLKTSTSQLNPKGDVGEPVFFTGTGLLLRFRARRGLHFMDRTYEYALSLLMEARRKYRKAARRRITSGR